MRDSFIMTNICPQSPQFNRGYWSKLEKHVRGLTKTAVAVHVVSGALYLPRVEKDGSKWVKYQVIGNNDVAVPIHFFKVIVLENASGNRIGTAYILPNTSIPADTPLEKFQTTVQTVERVSGILFAPIITAR
jgi:endonuclease G